MYKSFEYIQLVHNNTTAYSIAKSEFNRQGMVINNTFYSKESKNKIKTIQYMVCVSDLLETK